MTPLPDGTPRRADRIDTGHVVFRFGGSRVVGQFVTGDWWVVGDASDPVPVTRITPDHVAEQGIIGWHRSRAKRGERHRNGAMVNPHALRKGQGFDNYAYEPRGSQRVPYDPALNLDPAATGQTLLLRGGTILKAVGVAFDTPPTDGTGTIRTRIERYVPLTVLPEVPPPRSFRPPIAGTDKTVPGQFDALDLGPLPRLDLSGIGGVPTADEAARALPLVMSWSMAEDRTRCLTAFAQWPDYGREQAYLIADAMVPLLSDRMTDAQKARIAIQAIQAGIDLAGAVRAGGRFPPNGGFELARKPLVVLAGLMLRSRPILEICDYRRHPDLFASDNQWGYVTPAWVDTALKQDGKAGRAFATPYDPAHVGMPEWGIQAGRNLSRNNSDYRVAYRGIGLSILGATLAAHLLGGGAEAWNNPAIVQGFDRLLPIKAAGGFKREPGLRDWHQALWDRHRPRVPVPVWTGVPERPYPPLCYPASDTTTAVEVAPDPWAIDNGHPITTADLRYRQGQSDWRTIEGLTPRGATVIEGLEEGTPVYVQMRYRNRAGAGPWSVNTPASNDSEVLRGVCRPEATASTSRGLAPTSFVRDDDGPDKANRTRIAPGGMPTRGRYLVGQLFQSYERVKARLPWPVSGAGQDAEELVRSSNTPGGVPWLTALHTLDGGPGDLSYTGDSKEGFSALVVWEIGQRRVLSVADGKDKITFRGLPRGAVVLAVARGSADWFGLGADGSATGRNGHVFSWASASLPEGGELAIGTRGAILAVALA